MLRKPPSQTHTESPPLYCSFRLSFQKPKSVSVQVICTCIFTDLFSVFFKNIHLFTFRQRGREARKRTEISMCGCLLCAPPLGAWPATQACALTGNQTSDPLVYRPMLNLLSHTSQGCICIFLKKCLLIYESHTIEFTFLEWTVK